MSIRHVLVLCLLVIVSTIAHADERTITAFSTGGADVTVSHHRNNYLRFGVAAWGPKWAWTRPSGRTESREGATVGSLGIKIKDAAAPVSLLYRAESPHPKNLVLTYELLADADTALTLICVELTPGKALDGRDVTVESAGKQSTVPRPFGKRGLGSNVSSVRFADAQGKATVLRFDPPCLIESDGAARIVLAKGKLPGGVPQRLTVSVEFPEAANWYPSVGEIPDEAGFDTWYPWQAKAGAGKSMIGMEDWLERPAGKHGRIVRRDDALLYDGKPIKLWGSNLCFATCAPDKTLADKRARFYSKYGINAVRLHKYADGAGWAGIQSKDSFVEFDPEGLDRMDYQVARFKEAGIYVKLSAHFGSQKLGPADKRFVPYLEEFGQYRKNRITTPHSAVHYSPELQAAQIQQMVNLLKHKNLYTGLTYAKDPVIAFLEIINEQSIFFYSSMRPLQASATLRKQTGARFCDWLRGKYRDQRGLENTWGPKAFDSFAGEGFKTDGESLDKANILPLGNPWFWDPAQLGGSQAFRKQRLLDSLHFLYELQSGFYRRYVKAMREAGYEGEIVSSNWQAGRAFSHFANLHSDAQVGTIDRHNYFGANRANATMLARAGSGILSSGMQQVADRPFMLSEWIHVAPNEFGVEGPAIIGAYGMGLQGWDVSYMFQNRDNGVFSPTVGDDQWDVTAPQILGVFPAVARHILRGDIDQSSVVAARNVHAPSLLEGKLGFEDKVVQGYDDKELDSSKVPAQALAVARSVVAFTDNYEDTPVFDMKAYVKNGRIVSATGQLQWQEGSDGAGGYFTINTPATKAVVGFAQGQRLELGAVTIEPQCRFGAIYVTAREKDGDIASSRELLIVAIGRARNTGMKFSPAGDRVLAQGKGPILMEPVKVNITIRRKGAPKAIALDHNGKATNTTIPFTDQTLAIDGARDKTPYLLVTYR